MIPCIYIHHDRPFQWADQILAQSRKWGNKTFFISDQPQRTHDITKYREQYDAFLKVYSCQSSNGVWFESACFSRWFILAEFMRQENIPLAFHLDTDTVLYVNVSEEFPKWQNYDLTLVLGECGAACFITRERVQDFCDYVLRVYTEKGETYQGLVHIYEELQRQHLDGGISDMMLLKLYRLQNGIPYGEMTDIREGKTYDHIMRSANPGGYRMWEEIKDIEFSEGVPYGTVEATGEKIRFCSLHFQGQVDRLIPCYVGIENGRPNIG